MSANDPKRTCAFIGSKIALAQKQVIVEEWVPTYQYRCEKCGESFERIESMAEHENAKAKFPKWDSKKVTQVPGRIHVVTSKKS
jgi:putative FmdB family regulatory protein